ncbi:hypothetical protein YC2023_089377 [Brassica napus]
MQVAIHILDMGVYIGGSLIGGDQQQGGLPICPDNISFGTLRKCLSSKLTITDDKTAVEYLAENKLRIFVDVQGNFRAITKIYQKYILKKFRVQTYSDLVRLAANNINLVAKGPPHKQYLEEFPYINNPTLAINISK